MWRLYAYRYYSPHTDLIWMHHLDSLDSWQAESLCLMLVAVPASGLGFAASALHNFFKLFKIL